MTTVSRIFQTSFSKTLLRSAALAIVLLVQASPSHSEMIDLTCTFTSSGHNGNIRLLIDTDHNTVTKFYIGVFGPTHSSPYTATITPQFIQFSGRFAGNSDYSVEGILDRIAGTFNETVVGSNGRQELLSYACRRATQKF